MQLLNLKHIKRLGLFPKFLCAIKQANIFFKNNTIVFNFIMFISTKTQYLNSEYFRDTFHIFKLKICLQNPHNKNCV